MPSVAIHCYSAVLRNVGKLSYLINRVSPIARAVANRHPQSINKAIHRFARPVHTNVCGSEKKGTFKMSSHVQEFHLFKLLGSFSDYLSAISIR